MESSTLPLISEIGPQHHLVVNEEGIVQFTDDGDELLVYDDCKSIFVRFLLSLNALTTLRRPLDPTLS